MRFQFKKETAEIRHAEIDILRGSAVLLLALFVLGAGPLDVWGDSEVVAPLRSHLIGSLWHGFYLFDLVMPVFLFCTGAAVSLRVGRLSEGQVTSKVLSHFIYRAVILFVLGVALVNIAFPGNFAGFQLTGALQQIAFTGLAVCLLRLFLPVAAQVGLLVFLAVNFSLVLNSYEVERYQDTQLLPVFPYGFQNNLASHIDSHWLPGVAQFGNWSQFGVLPVLAGLVLALAGNLYVQWVTLALQEKQSERSGVCAGLAVFLLANGWFLKTEIPVNHYLWTGSFLCLSGGGVLLALSLLGAQQKRYPTVRWQSLQALGRNALFFYVLLQLLDVFGITRLNYTVIETLLPDSIQKSGLLVLSLVEVGLIVWLALWLQFHGRYFTLNRFLKKGSEPLRDQSPVPETASA